MASKAQAALSANLQALSYALGLAKETEESGFNVNVGSGRRAGPLERRRQDPEIATPGDMGLEFEPGKPLKNFGRMLASSAGIPLPYNFRQAAEASEQARINFENENAMFADMARTFLDTAEHNASVSSDPSEERIYQHFAAQGLDAANAFSAQDASPEQRALAFQQLTKLNDSMQAVATADVNELLKFKRGFVSQEVSGMRQGLENAYMASNDRLMRMDDAAAQWEVLRGDPRSAQAQAFLRSQIEGTLNRSSSALGNIAQAVGGAAGVAPNPYMQGASAILSSLGSYMNKEDLILDGDRVMQQVLAAYDSVGAVEEQFLPQLQQRLKDRTADSVRLGIPGDSWATDRFKIDTPNTERLREALKAPRQENTISDNTADYLRRRADRMDERSRRETR